MMLSDLESLHDELFQAWQITSAMTNAIAKLIQELRADATR